MPNQLVSGGTIVQNTTLGLDFVNQLVTGTSKQATSQACIVDLIPPIFAGIDFLTRGPLGQLRVSWLAATDTSNPIRYEVYVKPNDSLNLFSTTNIAIVTTQLNTDIFAIANGTLLQTGVRYYVGVRAVDAVGNRDNNTVSLNQTSPGITGATNAQINGVFAVNTNNNLIATFWVNDNDGIITNPARLGSATYVIYDNNGNLVPGMTESGIIADSEGFFETTPIPSLLSLDNTFYTVKVSIPVDGMQIIYNLPITYPETGPKYEPRAIFSINASNQLQGTLWCTRDGELIDAFLGTASFTIYDKDGNSIGINQSGLVADANGYYEIVPTNAASILDLTHYVVKLNITAAGQTRVGTVGITLGE
jgi:hypothetical protein